MNCFYQRFNSLKRLLLNSNYVYHCECVGELRHNRTLYSRIPRHYLVCYDIYDIYNISNAQYLEYAEKSLECVPCLYINTDPNIFFPDKIIKERLAAIDGGTIKSLLGGTPEGVVLKHERLWRKGKFVATKRTA